MSRTSHLVLALAGVLLFTLTGRCNCEDHGRRELADDGCQQSGTLRPTKNHSCDECCKVGQAYPTHKCSPPVTGSTRAIMTLNGFEEGGDGGDPSECDGKFHKSSSERVVALSTGWYANGKRCGKNIRINAKGRSLLAMVVDECDSQDGCDRPHAYQPPCRPNNVDASQAMWDALGITGDDDVGEYPITWSEMPERSAGTRLHALCRTVATVSVAVLCASSM